jgi:hypothetical protein
VDPVPSSDESALVPLEVVVVESPPLELIGAPGALGSVV